MTKTPTVGEWIDFAFHLIRGDPMPMILIDSGEWNRMVNKIDSLGVKVDTLLARLKLVDTARLEELMADTHKSLDDIISDIQDLKTREDGLVELVGGIQQQLKDALAGVNLTPDQQAKVDAIFDAVEERKKSIQDAIDANTPPPPTNPNAPQVNPL